MHFTHLLFIALAGGALGGTALAAYWGILHGVLHVPPGGWSAVGEALILGGALLGSQLGYSYSLMQTEGTSFVERWLVGIFAAFFMGMLLGGVLVVYEHKVHLYLRESIVQLLTAQLGSVVERNGWLFPLLKNASPWGLWGIVQISVWGVGSLMALFLAAIPWRRQASHRENS